MTIAAHAVGASEGYVYVRSEYPHAVAALRRAIDAAYTHGYLGQRHPRLGPRLRPARAGRRRRLHLRRGVLDAREPRGPPRRGAGQAADPGDQGPVGPADRGQQRAHALRGADDPGRRRRGVRRARHRPLPRHPGLPAGRQHQAGRHRRAAVRREPARARRGVRRRHADRPAGAGGAGRRPARRLRAGDRLRRPDGLRGAGRVRRDARARRHRGLRRDRRHGPDGAVRDGVLLDRVVRQVHAVPGRVDARRGDASTGSSPGRTSQPTSCCSTTCATP